MSVLESIRMTFAATFLIALLLRIVAYLAERSPPAEVVADE